MSELNPYSPLNTRLQEVYVDDSILEIILSQKEILPLLIGIDKELDKVLAERMKK